MTYTKNTKQTETALIDWNKTSFFSSPAKRHIGTALSKLALGAGLLFAGIASAENISGSLVFDFNPAHVARPAQKSELPPITLEIGRCATPPEIDGVGTDDCWISAVELSDFAIKEPFTTVRFCYDDKFLYFLVRCEALPEQKPSGKARPRDDQLWQDDNVHFVISPAIDSDQEYLFQVNVKGSYYDAHMGDESWNPRWQRAVAQDDKGWTVEVAIPFGILGLNVAPPALGFNIGRSGPGLIIRSWNSSLHVSTACSALLLEKVPVAPSSEADRESFSSTVNVAQQGDSLNLSLPRAFARPQDRWIDATILLRPENSLEDSHLVASLYPLGAHEPVESLTVIPGSDCGLLSIDLRRHNLTEAELTLEYFEGGKLLGLVKTFLAAQVVNALPHGQKIQINIDLPPGEEDVNAWPVSFGVPFPRGVLWSIDNLRLVDKYDIEIPSQAEVLSYWSKEGAIQWVRFDALVNSERGCFVVCGQPAIQTDTALSLVAEGDDLILDTGSVKYILTRGASPVKEIWHNGKLLATSAGTKGLYVVDQQDRLGCAGMEDETVAIEASGPVAASVRFEGFYRTSDGINLARHITRIEAFAGQPFAKITHTLVLSESTQEIWFKEIGWEFAVTPGADPQAIFNTDRENASQIIAHNLTGNASAYMLQREHERFGGGTNIFEVVAENSRLAAGSECGDWAMLKGKANGLLFACKEAARQHPKEFEIFADRFVLKLFSDRAGEELTFAPAALAERWHLTGKMAEDVRSAETDAAGWSKTHELLLSPVAETEIAARYAALHADPIYALVEPQWLRDTEAMGYLHPKDEKNFPEAEAVIESVFQQWGSRGHETGHYGFVDYFAGPTYNGSSGYCSAQRYRFTYGLRPSIWLVYARSGDRRVRKFAEGTNKAFLDNYLTHWDIPGKGQGLYTRSGGRPYGTLPYYWGLAGQSHSFNLSSSTDLNQFIWMYYLTGYRRGKDAVENFAEGLKTHWDPEYRDWRQLMSFRVLTQCYGLTWDPVLRALAEKTFDVFTDLDGELLLSKNRPYNSSSYKTHVDLRAIIEGWRLFGYPKYQQTALALSRHWFGVMIGVRPIGYMNPFGVAGTYLYHETEDPILPALLDFGLRRASTLRGGTGASPIASVLESMPYAMSAVAESERPFTSWVAYRDYGNKASVMFMKKHNSLIDLRVKAAPGEIGRQFALRGVNLNTTWGRDLDRVTEYSSAAASVRVPKDAPGGCYEIAPEESGDQSVFANSLVPMVLYATNYWGLPEIAPAAAVYFKIAPKDVGARIFFEGLTKLFDPEGNSFGNPEGFKGWVELPAAEKPGLWKFEPIENLLVRGENFAPFYAFERAENYFMPPVVWESDQEEADAQGAVTPSPDALFVPGALTFSDDQALSLMGKRSFVLDAGPDHPSGNGGQYIPQISGTVEFFLKPYWSTFDLGAGAVKRSFIQIKTDKDNWGLTHRVDPEGVNMNLAPKDPSHSLYAGMYLNTPKPAHLRVWRVNSIFDSHKWVHVAWSWGPEIRRGPRKEKLNLMTTRIFLNGRGTQAVIFRSAVDALPQGKPEKLTFFSVQGAVDELRISDIQRYTEDFTPPTRKEHLELDEHTRALFHFDGTLEGRSYEATSAPLGLIQ